MFKRGVAISIHPKSSKFSDSGNSALFLPSLKMTGSIFFLFIFFLNNILGWHTA